MREPSQRPESTLDTVRVTLRVAQRTEPWLLWVALGVGIAAFVPEALAAVWLKVLADAVPARNATWMDVAIFGLATTAMGGWLLRMLGERPFRRFGERAAVALEAHIAGLQGQLATLEHFERPEHQSRLTVLRDQVWRIANVYGALVTALGALARIVIAASLLVIVDVRLAFLAVFALPLYFVPQWRGGRTRDLWTKTAPLRLRARRLFELGTGPSSAKELRVAGTRGIVDARRAEAVAAAFNAEARERRLGASAMGLAWLLFGAAYVLAVAYVAAAHTGPARVGDVIIALLAGANLVAYVTAAAGRAEELRFMVQGARDLVWLERWAAAHEERASGEPPRRLARGLELRNVSFRYPGTDRDVLDGVNLHLRPGSVVALVGENGAGKSTLVKLLTRMYAPTSGVVLVDGVDFATMSAARWRERVSGAFQDFFRFEYRLAEAVGIGHLERMDHRETVRAAVAQGAADAVVSSLPDGLDAQLGAQWPRGTDLSAGQWQRIALARAFMRPDPLLVVLDEPSASLDAETEFELFERFAAGAKKHRSAGTITLLVSHRFSTVRMADQIIVLSGSTVVEAGTHHALVDAGGLYASLYGIHAAAYRGSRERGGLCAESATGTE